MPRLLPVHPGRPPTATLLRSPPTGSACSPSPTCWAAPAEPPTRPSTRPIPSPPARRTSAAGQAGHLPVHARRAVAGRHLRLQAAAPARRRQAAARSPKPRVEFARDRQAARARPGSSGSTARAGIWVQRPVPARRDARRRPVHHQLDARDERAPRRALLQLHTGERHVRPAEHGLVDHLRPGDREPEPARVRHHLPDARPRRRAATGRRPSCRRPTRARRSATPASRRPGARSATSPTPATPPTSSGMQLDLLREIEPRAPRAERAATRRSRAASTSFELAFRMQAAVPELQDLSRRVAGDAEALRHRRRSRPTNFGRQCLLARRFAEARRAVRPGARTATSGTSTAT